MKCIIWCCHTLSYVSPCVFSDFFFPFLSSIWLFPFSTDFPNKPIIQSVTVFLTMIFSKDCYIGSFLSGYLRCLLTILVFIDFKLYGNLMRYTDEHQLLLRHLHWTHLVTDKVEKFYTIAAKMKSHMPVQLHQSWWVTIFKLPQVVVTW